MSSYRGGGGARRRRPACVAGAWDGARRAAGWPCPRRRAAASPSPRSPPPPPPPRLCNNNYFDSLYSSFTLDTLVFSHPKVHFAVERYMPAEAARVARQFFVTILQLLLGTSSCRCRLPLYFKVFLYIIH